LPGLLIGVYLRSSAVSLLFFLAALAVQLLLLFFRRVPGVLCGERLGFQKP
jgi:hypothetical protein